MGEAEKDESLIEERRRVDKDNVREKVKIERKKILIRTNMYRTVRTYLSSARDQIYSHEWISIGAAGSRSFLGAVT